MLKTFLTVTACLHWSQAMGQRQCCDPGQVLDTETISCVLENTTERTKSEINLQDCMENDLFVMPESTVYSTHGGGGQTLKQDSFCFSISETGEEVVASCNACMSVPCIQLCCPPGHVWVEDKSWRQPRCGEGDMKPPLTCAPGDVELPGGTFIFQGKKHHYIDNSDPSGSFNCQPPSNDEHSSLVSVSEYYQHYSLTQEGMLLASYPGAEHTFNTSQFCLVHAQAPGETLLPTFRFCLPEKKEAREGEEFTMIFYPTAILISSMFLFLTLIAYLINPDLHKPLFGKITLGFIINNIAAYICSSFRYLSETYSNSVSLNSLPCIVVGFLMFYTFTCLMFWINAMAANIFFKFSSVVSPPENESSNFKFYILYAQGLPLLLTFLLALLDQYGPCDWILPNMGSVQCFLGSPWEEQWAQDGTPLEKLKASFLTSEFLYFHSILLLLQTTNIIFFLLTVKYLINHWRMTGNVLQVESRGNFLIVVKLFFIMGIPWLGEFLSHIMIHTGGVSNFGYQVFVDLLNLFSGVLVFFVLVCKVKMVKRLAAKMRGGKKKQVEYTMTTRSSFLGDRDRQCGVQLMAERC